MSEDKKAGFCVCSSYLRVVLLCFWCNHSWSTQIYKSFALLFQACYSSFLKIFGACVKPTFRKTFVCLVQHVVNFYFIFGIFFLLLVALLFFLHLYHLSIGFTPFSYCNAFFLIFEEGYLMRLIPFVMTHGGNEERWIKPPWR